MATPTTFAPVVTNPGGTGTTITPILPSGHAAGDVIEIWVGVTGVTAWSAPAGWTIKQATSSSGNASTGVRGTILYRRVLPGDSLPLANPTCTLGATVTRAAIAFCKRGADVEGVHTLPEWQAFTTTAGTANPVRPLTTTTLSPENLVTHYYISRSATNAPEPSGYTETQQVVISGTMVINVAQKNVADQQTALANQDASPTSGARWVGMISCTPSPDYGYYRSGSSAFQANATSATPALPTGTSASDNRSNKDLIIATIECAGTPTIAPNTPADWTEITGWANTTSGNGTTVRKYRAFYDGSLDRQFNRSTSGEIFVYFSVYRNAHQTFPLSGAAVQQNASSTSGTWPTMDRTSTKATIQLTCVADATPTYTTPSPWTERNDSQGVVCADQSFNATGTVLSGSFTLNGASPTLCGLLEVNSVASLIVISVVPASASLSLTTFAPTIVATNNITVIPATVSLAATGFAPSLTMAGELADDFSDNSRDVSKWTLGSIAFSNAGVGVDEANQQIEISPLANESSPAIYGYKSVNDWNFTGKQAAIRLADTPDSNTEAWLVVALDLDNYVRTWFAGGSIFTRSREGGNNTNEDHGSFNFSTQDHWRIRHDTGPNEIVWEVSGDGSTWTELRRLTPAFAITSVSFYLSGGTGASIATPGLIEFDDFNHSAPSLAETVVPYTASLSLTTFAPKLIQAITPAVATLSLTTFTPSLSERVTPSTSSLTLTAFAPVIEITNDVMVAPGIAPLTLTLFGPSLRTSVIPAPQSLTLATFAVQLAERTTPATTSLTLATFTPTIVANVTIGPNAASLATTTFAPSLRETAILGSVSLSLNTFAPSASVNVIVQPQVATLALTVFGPSLNVAATPATASLSISTYAPILNLTPQTVTLTLSTFAPLVTVGDSVIVEPPVASLTIITFAPSIIAPVTVTPGIAQLTLTTFGPSLHLAVSPQTEALSLTAFSSSLTKIITPSTANLSITSAAPSLALSLQPITSTLTLAAFAPTVTNGVGTDVIVIPATATMTLITATPHTRRGPTPPRRTFVVQSARRITIVPRSNRVYVVPESDREETVA